MNFKRFLNNFIAFRNNKDLSFDKIINWLSLELNKNHVKKVYFDNIPDLINKINLVKGTSNDERAWPFQALLLSDTENNIYVFSNSTDLPCASIASLIQDIVIEHRMRNNSDLKLADFPSDVLSISEIWCGPFMPSLVIIENNEVVKEYYISCDMNTHIMSIDINGDLLPNETMLDIKKIQHGNPMNYNDYEFYCKYFGVNNILSASFPKKIDKLLFCEFLDATQAQDQVIYLNEEDQKCLKAIPKSWLEVFPDYIGEVFDERAEIDNSAEHERVVAAQTERWLRFREFLMNQLKECGVTPKDLIFHREKNALRVKQRPSGGGPYLSFVLPDNAHYGEQACRDWYVMESYHDCRAVETMLIGVDHNHNAYLKLSFKRGKKEKFTYTSLEDRRQPLPIYYANDIDDGKWETFEF